MGQGPQEVQPHWEGPADGPEQSVLVELHPGEGTKAAVSGGKGQAPETGPVELLVETPAFLCTAAPTWLSRPSSLRLSSLRLALRPDLPTPWGPGRVWVSLGVVLEVGHPLIPDPLPAQPHSDS